MKKPLLLILAALACPSAFAEPIDEARMQADCEKIRSYAVQGDRFYTGRQYDKAREQYERQVAWAESCGLDDARIATAYNNVALTYLHQQQYLKGFAWLQLAPDDEKSRINLQKHRVQITAAERASAQTPSGTYWRYAGKASWNIISVQPAGERYRFEFQGLHPGLMALYYGPNLGEFVTEQPVEAGRATYVMNPESEGNCTFTFRFENNRLEVERVAGDFYECGFGHNVGAEGTYYKVAD